MMWVVTWILATMLWAWFAYTVGRWQGAAAANRYHIDQKIEHERECHGR